MCSPEPLGDPCERGISEHLHIPGFPPSPELVRSSSFSPLQLRKCLSRTLPRWLEVCNSATKRVNELTALIIVTALIILGAPQGISCNLIACSKVLHWKDEGGEYLLALPEAADSSRSEQPRG